MHSALWGKRNLFFAFASPGIYLAEGGFPDKFRFASVSPGIVLKGTNVRSSEHSFPIETMKTNNNYEEKQQLPLTLLSVHFCILFWLPKLHLYPTSFSWSSNLQRLLKTSTCYHMII